MDYSPFAMQILSGLWFVLPLVFLGAFLRSSWFKGRIGEWLVNRAIKSTLPKRDYHLFKDVTLSTEDGTTQIDHIIVSKFGVFVLETKNMRGWILGSSNQKLWTQKIYKHNSKFQNPLRQNYKHTQTLESMLELPAESVRSVIVFVGDSKFKTKMPPNVTDASSFVRHIKSFTQPLLTSTEVKRVCKTIEDKRLERGFKTNREHVRHLNEKNLESTASSAKSTAPSNTSENNSCPKCGAKMIQRTTKKGPNKGNQFWGCSTFPKCRGVIAYSGEAKESDA